MKKLLLIAGLLWSAIASAQFVPGQVLTAAELNSQFALYAPLTGATFTGPIAATSATFSGLVSVPGLTATGTISLPSASLPLSYLALQAANTLVANASGSSASPTAISAPSCSTSSSALQWTSGTGLACNSAINASTLGGVAAASYLTSATAASTYATIAQATTALAATGGSINGVSIGAATASTVAATTLSASANDALLYVNTSAQSIPTGAQTTITTWTKISDRVNANFSASTGVFTAPVTGFYHVDAGLFYAASANTAGNQFQVVVVGNGVNQCLGSTAVQATAVSTTLDAVTSCMVSLTSGQTIVIQAFQNSGAARPLGVTSATSYVSITRIP